jgi:hypothetical protein
MRPPLPTPYQWPPVPLATLSRRVSLVPLVRLRLRELLALLVPHRRPNPLRHILVLLLATWLVLPVFLPLLPLSLLSSRRPEHVSFLHTSHKIARLEGPVHPSDTIIKSCLETQSIFFFCPIRACLLLLLLDAFTRLILCTFAHVIAKLDFISQALFCSKSEPYR